MNCSQTDAERLAGLIPRMMRALQPAHMDSPLAKLPVGLLRVCSALRSGPRPMAMIGDDLEITRSATSQLAERLERLGLVERIGSPPDRRTRLLRLTEHGEAVMAARQSLRVERAAMCLERIAPTARTVLLDGLEAMVDGGPPAVPGVADADSAGGVKMDGTNQPHMGV
jgi:DNA-binding MarR family transcriptional regulator